MDFRGLSPIEHHLDSVFNKRQDQRFASPRISAMAPLDDGLPLNGDVEGADCCQFESDSFDAFGHSVMATLNGVRYGCIGLVIVLATIAVSSCYPMGFAS